MALILASWIDVYEYLSVYDLTVPGGRLGPVGVPGLLLAGGVNFYGNQVGFSCNSVINYEVVLANGTVVYANQTSNSDLFWALKGGSSNFGIVTRFDIETIKSPMVWAGAHTVEAQYVDQFLAVSVFFGRFNYFECATDREYQAIAEYAANISDPKTHIVPALVPGDSTLASAILFYDSDSLSYPDILKPFTDIPSVSSTVGFKTVAEFAAELGELVVNGIK